MNQKLCKILRYLAKHAVDKPTTYLFRTIRKTRWENDENGIPKEIIEKVSVQHTVFPQCTRGVYRNLKRLARRNGLSRSEALIAKQQGHNGIKDTPLIPETNSAG